MRRSNVGVALFMVLPALLALTACGSEDTQTPADPNQLDLVGQTFLSNDVRVSDQPYPLVKGSQLRLSFEDGAIGASAGCNSMSGDARWSTGTLTIDGQSLAMTEMGCDEPLMQQDTWFADILTSKPTLLQDDTTLTLTSDDTVIVFTDEEVVVPDASLTGTPWKLDSIIAGDAASSVPEGVTSTITFGDDGQGRSRARLQQRKRLIHGHRGHPQDRTDRHDRDGLPSSRFRCRGKRARTPSG